MTEPAHKTELSVTEAAALLGVSTQSIRAWIRTGRLPATRIGLKVIRIRRADLDALTRPANEGGETHEARLDTTHAA